MIAAREDGSFREPDRRAFNAFAASVAQRLVAERSVEIERLRFGMEARERERTRWAREIHDETVQGLGALRLKLANARDLGDQAELSTAVDTVLEGLGAGDRRAAPPDHRASSRRARRLRACAGAGSARASCPGDGRPGDSDRDRAGPTGDRRLDAELESTLYRVVQEALTNVSRHAKATSAVISVSERDGKVTASVTDDGEGLPDGASQTAHRPRTN